jgi:hypothetical protein
MSRTVLGAAGLPEANISPGACLTLMHGPLEFGWRLSGVTSDFLAEAMALPYTGSKTRHANIHHSIEYLSNELIENALKFREPSDVFIEACVAADTFLMRVRNQIGPETSARFQHLLADILSEDPGERLIRQIEENAASDASGSGLGILTLLADYGARLAWEFEASDDRRVQLTTTASINIPLA